MIVHTRMNNTDETLFHIVLLHSFIVHKRVVVM